MQQFLLTVTIKVNSFFTTIDLRPVSKKKKNNRVYIFSIILNHVEHPPKKEVTLFVDVRSVQFVHPSPTANCTYTSQTKCVQAILESGLDATSK